MAQSYWVLTRKARGAVVLPVAVWEMTGLGMWWPLWLWGSTERNASRPAAARAAPSPCVDFHQDGQKYSPVCSAIMMRPIPLGNWYVCLWKGEWKQRFKGGMFVPQLLMFAFISETPLSCFCSFAPSAPLRGERGEACASDDLKTINLTSSAQGILLISLGSELPRKSVISPFCSGCRTLSPCPHVGRLPLLSR